MNALSVRPWTLCRPVLATRRSLVSSLVLRLGISQASLGISKASLGISKASLGISQSSKAVKTDRTPSKTPSYNPQGRAAARSTAKKYPERLLIFHAPASTTAIIGTSKVASILVFGFGCLILTPAAFFDDNTPLWLTATYLVGGAIPMLMTSFMTSPFVANIFIRLPLHARSSKDALIEFARRMPQDTVLEIQKIGFLPFPRSRTLQLSELRTIRSKAVLANLHHVPHSTAGERIPAWKRLAHYYLFARPTLSHWRKTPVPEIWPIVFEHAERNAIAAGAPSATVRDTTMQKLTPGRMQLPLSVPGKDRPRVSTIRSVGQPASIGEKRI